MNEMKYYRDAEDNYLGGWDSNPPTGAIEVPFPPEDARQKWGGDGWLPLPEEMPIGSPRVERACALCVSVAGSVVDGVKGTFNILGIFRMDTGSYMGFLVQPVPIEEELILVPNNGIHITLSERGEDYFFLEIRNHAGGDLIDPPTFGFTLYSF